jgi:DNA-binding MarR family transcriptional regulator
MERDDNAALAWLNLAQVYGTVRGALSRALEIEAGVGLSETEVLYRLGHAPAERLRMTDLADQLLMAQSGITRVVDRLVERGWVVREQPPDNRRTVYARLTDGGRAVLERARPVYVRSVGEQIGSALDPADVVDLRRLLRQVLERLGAWDDARCDPSGELDRASGRPVATATAAVTRRG